MGGRGSGGLRIGAGRKAKTQAEHALGGWAGKRKPKGQRSQTKPPPPSAVVARPGDLSEGQLDLWKELAPHAIAAGTLTPATVAAFRDLCEAILVKRALMEVLEAEGWTVFTEHGPKAHPLLSQYRGMLTRVEALFAKFRLSPMGKSMIEPEADSDPFGEFDDDAQRTH